MGEGGPTITTTRHSPAHADQHSECLEGGSHPGWGSLKPLGSCVIRAMISVIFSTPRAKPDLECMPYRCRFKSQLCSSLDCVTMGKSLNLSGLCSLVSSVAVMWIPWIKGQRLIIVNQSVFNRVIRTILVGLQASPPGLPGPQGVLTLGIFEVWGLGWQLLHILLEQQFVPRDSLHGLQHVMLQGQAA